MKISKVSTLIAKYQTLNTCNIMATTPLCVVFLDVYFYEALICIIFRSIGDTYRGK
jgi:hypothetical protein